MKPAISAVFAAGLFLSTGVLARDSVQHYPLQDVVNMPEAQGKLDGSVKFYLAGQKTPKILKRMSSDVSNKKTNSVGKGEEFGCRWRLFQRSYHSRSLRSGWVRTPWSTSSATTRRSNRKARPTTNAIPATSSLVSH